MHRIAFFFLIIFFFFSCGNIDYQKHHTFEKNTWHTDSLLEFNYNSLDTNYTYDVVLQLRHNVYYEFQNLFIFILESDKQDTVEFTVADKRGRWIGSGVGDVRKIELVYQKNKKLGHDFGFNFLIEQAMRYGDQSEIENLKHILSFGVIIKQNNE